MESIKIFAAISLAAIIAYFEPVHNILIAFVWIFAMNFLFGLVSGMVANKEKFNFRKAFKCFSEASVFFLILASVFFIGNQLGAKGQAMQTVSTIAYAAVYFYSVNIFKNLVQLFPNSKLIAFIHYLLSIEVLSRLPFVSRFLKKNEGTDRPKNALQ